MTDVRPSPTNWTSPLSDVQQRLEKLDGLLRQAQLADGSVDLVRARELAGTDTAVSRLVTQLRWSDDSGFDMPSLETTLTPEQAQAQFLELQNALKLAATLDTNGDRSLGYEEVPFTLESSTAHDLVKQAATPIDRAWANQPAPAVTLSREARLEAERIITEIAHHHAETPAGAEALKWDMRLRLVQGIDVNDFSLRATVDFAEFSWKRHLPGIGQRVLEAKGHLSDEELSRFLGTDLESFCAQQRVEVKAQLLMDYETFLEAPDLETR